MQKEGTMSTEIKTIIQNISLLRDKKSGIEEEEATQWRRFYEIADDIVGPGQNYRFTDPELKQTIAREMHQQSPRTDPAKLEAGLSHEEWLMVTQQVRILDLNKLERALGLGELSPEGLQVVREATEHPEPVPHKKFSAATKKDLEGG